MVPITDSFSDGDFPEVELIVEDPSKFGKAAVSKPNIMLNDDSGRSKPKITSWGNPSSPSNIPETLSDSSYGPRATDPFPGEDEFS